jgi:hypothetical protein
MGCREAAAARRAGTLLVRIRVQVGRRIFPDVLTQKGELK